MLTDLSFLEQGQKFPPESEAARLEMYEINRALFETKHSDVYKKQLERIERVIGNFDQVISYQVLFNFQKKMSLKVADLLLGEPPQITASKETEQATIDAIKKKSDLDNTSYETAIDISRYGDGLLYVRQDPKDGAGIIDITQPSAWFPVVSPDNVKDVTHHVLAWVYTTGSGDSKRKHLKAMVHEKGAYEIRQHELEGTTIGREEAVPERFLLPLDDFAVIQIPNVITSDRATGLDDYTDIDSIVAELMVRVGQVARILDKHADPSMYGPESALERDPKTGRWSLKAGSYFIAENDAGNAAPVGYIVWDGQLEAAFKQIDRLINMLYTISEMGSALFGDMNDKTGAAPSGTALRRLMISPLAKVNRIRMRFDPALKKAIRLCSMIGGPGITSLKDTELSIKWADGLPGDPMEEATIIDLRTAKKATMSQKRAMMTYDGLSEADAEAELAEILDAEAQANPLDIPDIGGEVNEADLEEGEDDGQDFTE